MSLKLYFIALADRRPIDPPRNELQQKSNETEILTLMLIVSFTIAIVQLKVVDSQLSVAEKK
jgi:hypothetical protein